MKLKRVLKYLLLAVLIGFLGFLYGFTSKRNNEKKVTKIEVKFEAGNNNFLTHAMVDKLLIQNNKTVQNQAKSTLD
jgi:cell division protein FtsQ